MSSMQTLIDELKTQKDIITSKSGVVAQAGKHPSPSEITEGIRTIPASDLSGSTATEADVAYGKTFFSGNAVLKTGTNMVDPLMTQALFCPPMKEIIYENEISYAFPDNIKTIKKYLFYNNYHTVEIEFDNAATTIEEYAFYGTKNFKFLNFNDLTNLSVVGAASFQLSSAEGIDFSRLPNSITALKNSCFYAVPVYNPSYRFPDNLTDLGNSVFKQEVRTVANSVDFSNFKYSSTCTSTFENIAFNCDLVLPNSVLAIASYFNYNGCFKSITIPSSVKNIYNYAFGSVDYYPLSNFYCNSVTFERETPPTIQANVFAKQNVTNGFKIYVPDNSLEAYKAVSNLAYYVDCIVPVSEKE